MDFMKKIHIKKCTSNFPVSSKYYCSDDKKVLGKMKDEYVDKSILKFVGLKSKMY